MKRTSGEKVFNVFNIIILSALAISTLYPFVYMATISLSTAAEASRDGFHLWPGEISLTAYKMVFTNPEILLGYINTVGRTVIGTFLTVIVTCMCAYPLSKKHLPHRSLITFIIMFTMLFNGGLVPAYLLVKNLGMIDSYLVYILPPLTAAFNIIIVKNFFQSIPQSLAVSAQIDGASDYYILFKIYMPLSKPVLATITLWTAVTHWNMWFDALLYINSESKLTLQMFLRRIVIEGSTEMIQKGIVNPDMMSFTPETIKAATVVVTILPILLFYPFIQKYFVKGIMLGGVKG
jgi:putative aldouronate transport system permease protein